MPLTAAVDVVGEDNVVLGLLGGLLALLLWAYLLAVGLVLGAERNAVLRRRAAT